jgi:hypothetical protein
MDKVWVLLPAQDKWDGKVDCSGACSGEVDGCGLRYASGGTRRKDLHRPCIGGQLVVVFHDVGGTASARGILQQSDLVKYLSNAFVFEEHHEPV